ncbi:DNA glycosylase/AP lyase ros1 [Cichlidogyrus casuarinus]|uniref:receptor protein-tyrosine kinase n=1 Tax=Cichlidogyrus casuarinus TaxID=1844966 RepID=A0ABD2QHD9_9PLAT
MAQEQLIRLIKSKKLSPHNNDDPSQYLAHYIRPSQENGASKINLLPLSSKCTDQSDQDYLTPSVDALEPEPKDFDQVPKIPAAHIRFVTYVGCGAFGKVWEGWLHINMEKKSESFKKVALKVRNSKTLTEAQFKREAALMQRYQHRNIVKFYGVSFDSPGLQCLVLEMMDQGSLRDYLHRARPQLSPSLVTGFQNAISSQKSSAAHSANTESTHVGSNLSQLADTNSNGTTVIELPASLNVADLIVIMKDIAHACEYLENQKFVHRDIAARNCLVSHSHPSGRIVKLCDFGLARDLYKNDYYRTCNEPKLPVRWMSPEAIREGLFTTKSDIWAYAVTCWEVMTLGADPFYGRMNMDVMTLVLAGHVLGRPENCPEELFVLYIA